MEKFSVKKPFTVLVAVVAIIVLGVVSVMNMTLDLLPQMSLPYLMVITTYPGASPERVESEVSEPMEDTLGTLENVKNVYSISSENYSMVELEFEDETDMDSALVRVSSALNELESTLPDACGTPSLMEVSMDMVATMYVAIGHEGDDIYELSDYAREEVMPYLERVEGVASVSDIGLVDKTIQVELNRDKIDELNDDILAQTNSALEDARAQLEDAQAQVDEAQAELEAQESTFGETLSAAIFDQIDGPAASAAASLSAQLKSASTQLSSLASAAENLGEGDDYDTVQSALEDAQAARDEAQAKLDAAREVVDEAQTVYENALSALEEAGDEADASLTEAADLARQALVDAQNDLATAASEFAQAARVVSEAAASIITTVDMSGLAEQLQELSSDASELASSIDGSSLTAFLSSVTKVATLIPRIEAVVTTIQAADIGGNLSSQISSVNSGISAVTALLDNAPALLTGLESSYASLTQGQLDAAVGFSTAAIQLYDAQAQLEDAQAQLEAARAAALANANADALLSTSTLAQMIYAQNFSMPAGYIDDENDNSWLLKVGDEFEDETELADSLLCDIDGIGTVRLSDVADITIIDNADESYTKLNGSDGVVFAVYKSSASSTNTVSNNIKEAFRALQAEDPDLSTVILMDQGEYIELIVEDILSSMILGGLLAIIVLAVFLRTVRPTVVVAMSIPLSVLFALVLMYFTGLTLNIMTLAGLSLGIGMLVDNSIVVLENIFRLRMRGIPAARAAVQGTRQVRGAILSSTLTTICVFFPIVFANGTVRSLVVPLALSITYCLVASLLVAMTLVPAASSSILKHMHIQEGSTAGKVQKTYGRILRWCLRHKLAVIAPVAALMVLCVIYLANMGIVYFPDMEGNAVQITLVTDDDLSREDSYAEADNLTNAVLSLDGVTDVGVMDEGSTTGLVGAGSLSGSTEYGSYIYYVTPDSDVWSGKYDAFAEAIENSTSEIRGDVTVSAGGMSDMTALMSSGLTVNIYGSDVDELTDVSEDIMELVGQVEGFTEISNGTEDSEETLHLVIDRDKAMSYGLTVAQIYAEIAQRLTTSVTSTTVTVDGVEMDVVIKDTTNALTRENLLDLEFEEVSLTGTESSDSDLMESMSEGITPTLLDDSEEAEDGDGEETEESTTHTLGEFATIEETTAPSAINRENLKRYISVTAETEEGYNTTLLSRKLTTLLNDYEAPDGITVEVEGETSEVSDMVTQMVKMLALALLLIYLVMVAQFQSLLSPFIVLFTIPLAFTGGMLALIFAGQQLSLLALMGFLILIGTVVNNGIVFVDYANQLRLGGMERRDALVATGQTRMRPILMTALTTILAMAKLIFGTEIGSQLSRPMALVIVGGLLYATLMTLFIVPVFYDIFFRRQPLTIDVGEDIDDVPDDAAEFLEAMKREG